MERGEERRAGEENRGRLEIEERGPSVKRKEKRGDHQMIGEEKGGEYRRKEEREER